MGDVKAALALASLFSGSMVETERGQESPQDPTNTEHMFDSSDNDSNDTGDSSINNNDGDSSGVNDGEDEQSPSGLFGETPEEYEENESDSKNPGVQPTTTTGKNQNQKSIALHWKRLPS